MKFLGIVTRRVIVDNVSLQEGVFVGGLYYGFEEVIVVEKKMKGFKDEW